MAKLHFIWIVILLLLTGACGLNANQEKSLNRDIVQYVNAYNKHLRLLETSLTHPCVVDHLLSYGDSVFKNHFQHDNCELTNYRIGTIDSNGDTMTIALNFDYDSLQLSSNSNKKTIYARSFNNGLNWFFYEKKFKSLVHCNRIKNKVR